MYVFKRLLVLSSGLMIGFVFSSCLHRKFAKNLYPNSVFYNPSFPGGDPALAKFIQSHRDTTVLIPDSLNLYNDTFFEVHASVKIDTDGSILEAHSEWWLGDKYSGNEIDNMVKAMPKWMPAYEHNRKTGKKRPYKMITGFGVKYYYKSKKPK